MPTGVTSDRLAGTLLCTALGDALGLPCEGMSARSIARRFGRVDRFRLLAKTGFVSDDTEQSALIAQSLARHPDDVDAFVRAFRRALIGWFCRLPWGTGLATLRSCVRIGLDVSPSGVVSAGNGAAMGAAIVASSCTTSRSNGMSSGVLWLRSPTGTRGRSRERSSWQKSPHPVPQARTTWDERLTSTKPAVS